MADKSSLSYSGNMAQLELTVKNIDSLLQDLRYELQQLRSNISLDKAAAVPSSSFEEIKRRFGPDRQFEADGFFIKTSFIDVGLHITWENKNRYILRRRRYKCGPDSKGELAGNIVGYRSTKINANNGKMILNTKQQNGEIIEYDLPFGKTLYYKFICKKIKEFDVTSDSKNSKYEKPYTSNLQLDYVLRRMTEERGIEGEVIETVEDCEDVKILFNIRLPEEIEKVDVIPEEAILLAHEKTIMEADGVLDAFEEIEKSRRERIAKIEAMDIEHEEKENMKKLANRVYADVASSRIKW